MSYNPTQSARNNQVLFCGSGTNISFWQPELIKLFEAFTFVEKERLFRTALTNFYLNGGDDFSSSQTKRSVMVRNAVRRFRKFHSLIKTAHCSLWLKLRLTKSATKLFPPKESPRGAPAKSLSLSMATTGSLHGFRLTRANYFRVQMIFV